MFEKNCIRPNCSSPHEFITLTFPSYRLKVFLYNVYLWLVKHQGLLLLWNPSWVTSVFTRLWFSDNFTISLVSLVSCIIVCVRKMLTFISSYQNICLCWLLCWNVQLLCILEVIFYNNKTLFFFQTQSKLFTLNFIYTLFKTIYLRKYLNWETLLILISCITSPWSWSALIYPTL